LTERRCTQTRVLDTLLDYKKEKASSSFVGLYSSVEHH
jgi:hypothetical protein